MLKIKLKQKKWATLKNGRRTWTDTSSKKIYNNQYTQEKRNITNQYHQSLARCKSQPKWQATSYSL